MPRKLNPAYIKVGHGKAAPDENASRPSLTGAGLVGAGPNIGQPVTPVGSTFGGALTGEAFAGHIQDPKGAHKASAIEHDGHPDILLSSNVEGALDELIGTVTKRPPYLGQWDSSVAFSGIPDWGFLKLRDASLDNYPLTTGVVPLENLPSGADPADVFPYYFTAPGPAQDAEFTHPGEDPRTDWLWNTGLELDLGSVGMGYGRCHIGAFTRDGDVGPAPLEVMRTARLYPRPNALDVETGLPERVPVTISGTVFPADRGVIALFHFPPGVRGDMQAEFLGQPLITDETVVGGSQGRVVAALLLGNGILGDKCNVDAPCTEEHLCDGDPGGIFSLGKNPVSEKYDPFSFPGRASGQYDLHEIHTGLDGFGNELVAPWNDLDGDTVTGSARTAAATIPAPGQVRLGTDPDAGETPVGYGIPILGGTSAYFDVPPAPQSGSLGHAIKGDSLILSSNFFRYRLPALKDYTPETGLKWTPRGDYGFRTQETWRFFEVASLHAVDYPDGAAVPTTSPYLRSAGFYETGFDEDYWVWQIARFRHTFLMPSTKGSGLREEVGSYWLVHFKTEADFEKFARDGIFPWDATDGYDVYGYSLAGSPPSHIEEDGNVANEWPAATPPSSPDGPAPLFGYSANPYHGLRSTILLDPDGEALPAVLTASYDWTTNSAPGNESIMWVSGVAYHTPHLVANGGTSFQFTAIDLVLDAGFWTSFRTSQYDLTGGTSAPAIIASVNPLFLNFAPWAYDGTTGFGALPISLDVTTGAAGVEFIPDDSFLGRHRVEVPFDYLGSNAGGLFSDTNGPLDADSLTLSLPGRSILVQGDIQNPSFVRDAKLRAYLRRPMNHLADDTTTLPFAATDGHGQVLAPVDGKRLLFHSSHFDQTAQQGYFGNYVQNPLGAPPNIGYGAMTGAVGERDTRERFLDEVYRIVPPFTASIVGLGPYTAQALASLQGPGMQGWVGGPIEVPVIVSLAASPWNEVSWLDMECHVLDLTGADPNVSDGLQVVGLPDRNPPQSAAVQMPFPSSGMMVYPQEDFRSVSPESAVHFAGAQPDYTTAAGVRQFIRAFDAAWLRSGGSVTLSAAGTTSLVLRIDGLLLEDLEFTAPGPGGLADNRVAIAVKVPGLTTWMDIGRADGAGPSKQDMFADGAGCQVVGDETYNFQDPESGYVGCYVKVNVGPVAALFTNTGTWSSYLGGVWPIEGEAPVLIRVQMDDGVKDGYDLEHRKVGGVFEVVKTPGAAPNTVRGLMGLRLVHPQDDLVPSLEASGVTLL